MVRMMMGIEDMGQDQTAPIEFGDRGGGVAGVNESIRPCATPTGTQGVV